MGPIPVHWQAKAPVAAPCLACHITGLPHLSGTWSAAADCDLARLPRGGTLPVTGAGACEIAGVTTRQRRVRGNPKVLGGRSAMALRTPHTFLTFGSDLKEPVLSALIECRVRPHLSSRTKAPLSAPEGCLLFTVPGGSPHRPPATPNQARGPGMRKI